MTAAAVGRRPRPDRTAPVRDDRGSVAVLMCFIVVIAGALVTFLVDAGTRIDAANKADTYSAEAARAASSAIGPVPVTAQIRQIPPAVVTTRLAKQRSWL